MIVARGPLARAARLGSLLALGACTQSPFAATVRTFNRPVQAAFACLETATGEPRPLIDCTPDESGRTPTGLAMHALVLQEARGEVASVDLVSRVVIDADPSVPGYTFVEVDPLPTAIVVPALTPACAFVASAGADAIDALDLHVFRREGTSRVVAYEPLALPGAPTAMVLDPSESALWVAMPERSSVARVPIDGCSFGAIEEIALEATVPPGLAAPSIDDEGTSRYCPRTFVEAPLPTITPREVDPLEPVARPSVLAVGRELLVGDRALPLVHRVDFAARVPLAPFSVGATVRALAVTPEVPGSYTATDAARARYVYAVDDADGTVLALDYSDPASATFGAVLPIGAGSSTRPDRMPFLSAARTLEVVRPQYDEAAPFSALCNPSDISDEQASPSFATLRGVFLVVAMSDATLRFVDVFDTDAPCRGRVEGAADDCTNTSEPFVYVRRHRPRVGERPANVGVVASDVSFLVNGATVRLTDESPELDVIACPAPLRPIFAEDAVAGTGRVCGRDDPFEAVLEVWQAAWQGAIAGTASSTGNFEVIDEGTVALDARVDFCAAGVLGADDVAAAPAPEGTRSGDVIAITTTLSDAMSDDERCQRLVGLEGSSQSARPVLIPIRASSARPEGLREPYRGRLLFDADAPVLDRTTILTMADVLACFGDELVRFDVRTRGAFSVTGSRSGQRHRVVRGADGACEIDESLPVTWQARAIVGETFANDLVGFRIPTVPAGESSELRVTIGTVPATLNLDVGAASGGFGGRLLALPSDLVWNDVTQRLYVVDVERRGLVELALQPLQYTQSTFQ